MVALGFFKIMVGDFESKLQFPRKFVKKLEGVFPDKVVLETKYGEFWSINIEKIGEDYFLKHGWEQFVKYYKLEMCDLLHFKPIPGENLGFKIFMFSPNACEKEISFDTQDEDLPSYSSTSEAEQVSNQSKINDTIKGEGGELSDDFFVGKESQCLVLILKGHNKYRINIPMQFARANNLIGRENVRVENSEGKSWYVKLVTRPQQRQKVMEMRSGWYNFFTMNGLMCGDRCALEFIPESDCFRFHLFR